MAKGARNKARRAREKAKPLREKPDYSAYLVEFSAFEKLPREIRQQIYFYVGRIPIAKRMLLTNPHQDILTYSHQDNSHDRVIAMKDALFRPTFGQSWWATDSAFWQFFHADYFNEQGQSMMSKIEVSSLLAVSKSIRYELLHLLLDAGISVNIRGGGPGLQQWMFGRAHIQEIRELRSVATMSHVASFTLDLNRVDGAKVFCKNMTFIAQHAVNLREMNVEFSSLDQRPNLNPMIRSLHDLVRTTSSDRFELVGLSGQTLEKKGFSKTCAWAVAVIKEAQKNRYSESPRVHHVDINSIEEHHQKYYCCAELKCYH